MKPSLRVGVKVVMIDLKLLGGFADRQMDKGTLVFAESLLLLKIN